MVVEASFLSSINRLFVCCSRVSCTIVVEGSSCCSIVDSCRRVVEIQLVAVDRSVVCRSNGTGSSKVVEAGQIGYHHHHRRFGTIEVPILGHRSSEVV